MSNDVHRCITGPRCQGRVTEDGKHHPAKTERPQTLCEACLTAHIHAIGRLLRDYAMLHATIGERPTSTGEAVKSSKSPAIPINVHADRLMADIVEWAQRGALVIARKLNTAPPTGSRKLPPTRDPQTRKPITAEPDSIAQRSWKQAETTAAVQLQAYLRIIEPHIEELAYTPTHRTLMWKRPQRCAEHEAQLAEAESLVAVNDNPDNHAELERARLAAANCDPCNGWGHNGQAFGIEYVTGLDIVTRLSELHHLARQHLGHTRLRLRFDLPCPNCHAQTIGRDSGQAIIDCRTCGYSWTEREYKLLVGMHVEREVEETVLKPQLDEAHTRLDSIASLIADLKSDPAVNRSEAVQLILGALEPIMDGHPSPEERVVGTDKAEAIDRQLAEDDWTWKRDKPYKKPRKKPKQPVAESIPKIRQSSRSLVTDDGGLYLDEHTCASVCSKCQLIHAGDECP
ncbi:DNA binding protein [Mycobacterium phage Sparky]|uniref:Uncharacterized protein n=1 Tax=Mycobacterium phage Sparky TaxID=1527493 RepID=A0A076G8C4_9CAUD|nr:DNA binding protein [Mycobacterium phage Sparky]AII28229.1 hypothetical protein PBI_SPARKY_85 [Mycobacterium phage Sparky]